MSDEPIWWLPEDGPTNAKTKALARLLDNGVEFVELGRTGIWTWTKFEDIADDEKGGALLDIIYGKIDIRIIHTHRKIMDLYRVGDKWQIMDGYCDWIDANHDILTYWWKTIAAKTRPHPDHHPDLFKKWQEIVEESDV